MTTTPLTDLDVELLLSGTAVPGDDLDRDLMDLLGAMRVTADEEAPAPTAELALVLAGLAELAPAPRKRRTGKRIAAWFGGLGLGAQIAVSAAGAAAAVGMGGAVGVLPAPAQHAFDDAMHKVGLPSHHADPPADGGPSSTDGSGPQDTEPGTGGRGAHRADGADGSGSAGAHGSRDGGGNTGMDEGGPHDATGSVPGTAPAQSDTVVTPTPAQGQVGTPSQEPASEPGEDEGQGQGVTPTTGPGQGNGSENGQANGSANGSANGNVGNADGSTHGSSGGSGNEAGDATDGATSNAQDGRANSGDKGDKGDGKGGRGSTSGSATSSATSSGDVQPDEG